MIELKKISIAYDGHTVLTGEKFIAYDTGITVIYGESGSGKTSLLKSILLWEHQCEHYFFNGKLLEQKDFETIRNQYFASLFQQSTLIDQLNIAGHFDLFKRNQKAEELIEKLALQNLMKKYPPQLSGGEKTRVGLALAILRNQLILVLDEPTASLDTEMTRRIIELIQAYAKEHSVIISTHDRKIIEIADNVYEIEEKKLKHLKQQATESSKIFSVTDTVKLRMTQKIRLFQQIKRRRWLYHLVISILLVLSISTTSFGLSKIISGNTADHSLDSIYLREMLVYKALDETIQPDYSDSGNEYPLTRDEIISIESINHVEAVQGNMMLSQSSPAYLPEITREDQRSEMTVYDEKNEKLMSGRYPLEDTPLTFGTYLSNVDYSENILINTGIENGYFITQTFAEMLNLEITEETMLYLEAEVVIPQYTGYNDAYIGFPGEDGTINPEDMIPCCRVIGVPETIKLPISGVLTGRNMGPAGPSRGGSELFYMPYSIFSEYLEKNKVTESVDYAYNMDKHSYERIDSSLITEAMQVMHCEPFQPTSVIITVDDLAEKNNVIDQLNHMGYSVSTLMSQNYMIQYMNNTESNLFMIALTALCLVVLVYFIIQYLNLKSERQLTSFFAQIGFSKNQTIFLIAEKNIYEWGLKSIECLIFSFLYFYLSNKMGFILFSAYFSFIPIIFILSFVILFVYPMFILLIGGRKS